MTNNDDQQKLLNELLARVKNIEARLTALEEASGKPVRPAMPSRPPAEEKGAAATEPPALLDQPVPLVPPIPAAESSFKPAPYRPAMPQAPAAAPPGVSVEKKIVIWLSRLGIIMVFLAVGFFLKLAMDHMGPTGKVVIGIVAGAALLIAGELAERRKYGAVARAITGGGLAILYLAVFAAFAYFKLIGQVPAFGFMILVTAAGVLLSVRYNSQVIIVLALLGGFATPIMLSTHKDAQVALMSYMLLLDAGLIGIAFWRQWRTVSLFCFAATVILFLGWTAKFYSIDKFNLTFGFASAFFLLFSIVHILYCLIRAKTAQPEDLILITLNAATYFFGMYALFEDAHFDKAEGAWAFCLALLYFLQIRLAMERSAGDLNLQRFLGGLAVGLLTVAIPLQLDYESVTFIWALQAVVLTIYGFYARNDFIRWCGLVVMVIAIAHLFVADYEVFDRHVLQEQKLKLFISLGVSYFSVMASLGGIIWSYRRWRERVTERMDYMPVLTLVEAVVLLVFLQVVNHYAFRSGVYPHFIYKRSDRGEMLNVSLIFGAYASICIALGILYRWKTLRYFGLLVLAVALVKVFFYDMAGLATMYRVASFLVLGSLLIGLSFLYQKFKDRLETLVSPGPDEKAGER